MRTGTRRQSAMQMRNTIFTMTMPFVIIPSRASEFSGEAICKPCGVIIPASRPASTSRGFSERGSLDHGIHNHVAGAAGIHGEYYGVPQPQGHPRNTVFRGSL